MAVQTSVSPVKTLFSLLFLSSFPCETRLDLNSQLSCLNQPNVRMIGIEATKLQARIVFYIFVGLNF